MIGLYLSDLYTHCKAISLKDPSSSGKIKTWFQEKIIQISTELQIAGDENLIKHLQSPAFREALCSGQSDPYLSIFYLVNSLGEYSASASELDELGRYRYLCSVQKGTGITRNLVLEYILETVKKDAFLNRHFESRPHRSYFFLSHDIDALYGSVWQDGFWALKHFRLDVMLKILANAAMSKAHWFNMDLIAELESEYGFRSTFYWLVNKGRINKRERNSDYTIQSPGLKSCINNLSEKGFEHGLHKSISAEGFKSERRKMPLEVQGNRYHYLRFNLPDAYKTIEESGLKLDASLGFAEHYGFRNNYGYPFSPYDFSTGKAFNFLELPLNIMDGTFQRYLKLPVQETAQTIIHFFEEQRENAVLSILWHNTFFTNYKYKGYREEYRKILAFLYEEKFTNINQSDLIRQFAWKQN
ncbi:MAG TPA: hypothetical protein PLQ93_07980 [Bacteroidia bacterium]|nr:hypothetical protein [Bacteroidia bacterium]